MTRHVDGTRRAVRHAAWLVAYKGVRLDGREVWLIVVELDHDHGEFVPVSLAAGLGLLAVALLGLVPRAPLTRVPENGIKFVVGSALPAFGTFWT